MEGLRKDNCKNGRSKSRRTVRMEGIRKENCKDGRIKTRKL